MRIGVDPDGTKIEAAILDQHGRIALSRRIATPARDHGGTIAEMVASFGGRCASGPGFPGSVSPAAGLIRNANSIWLDGRGHSPPAWPGPSCHCRKTGRLEALLARPGLP